MSATLTNELRVRAAGTTMDEQTLELLRRACTLLHDTPPEIATAISVTTTVSDGEPEGVDLWLWCKRLAKQYDLHASATLRGQSLTARFERPAR